MVAVENMRSRFQRGGGSAEPGIFGCVRAAARRTVVGHGAVMTAGATDVFVEHRNLLFTVAWQDARLGRRCRGTCCRRPGCDGRGRPQPGARRPRLPGADRHRLTLNRMRTNARRRSRTSARGCLSRCSPPRRRRDVELADSVSLAMLTLLETLSPTERAVFVLREGLRLRIRRDRGRGRQDPGRRPPGRPPRPGARGRAAPRRAAEPHRARPGDAGLPHRGVDRRRPGLMDVLAPDVVLITDGGGVRRRRCGRSSAGQVLRFLDAVTTGIEAVVDVVEANGGAGAARRRRRR